MLGGPPNRPQPPVLTGDDVGPGSVAQPNSSLKPKKNVPPTSAQNGRFVLNVPPELNFKGDPPHWMRQLFLEPLLDGWKREIVGRGNSVKVSDVYYYAPSGRKFRSRREIGQFLLDNNIKKYNAAYNFTFNGKPLGGEFEPYEILRCAFTQPGPRRSKGDRPLKSTCSSYNHSSNSSSTSSLNAMGDNGRNSSKRPTPDSDVMVVDDDEDPEAGMIFDEEIEVVGTDDGQDAVFDPAVLSVREEPVRITHLPIVREPPITPRPMPPPKKRKLTQSPVVNKRYCICDDVEHGNMVLCDNGNCEIGWYHFACVKLSSGPIDKWYCPICRGATSDVLDNIPK